MEAALVAKLSTEVAPELLKKFTVPAEPVTSRVSVNALLRPTAKSPQMLVCFVLTVSTLLDWF